MHMQKHYSECFDVPQVKGPRAVLELVCHTEMQRIDGHAQTPLQLARVDDRHRAQGVGGSSHLVGYIPELQVGQVGLIHF